MFKILAIYLISIGSISSIALSSDANIYDVNTDIGANSDNVIPVPFRGDDPDSPVYLMYSDIDIILGQVVLDLGPSGRTKSGKATASPGSRIVMGNRSKLRLQGNRIDFKALSQPENLKILRKARNSLEMVPNEVPLYELSKNEQLAYWLNLYNITMLERVAAVYPARSLRKYFPSDGSKSEILDEKILNVAGVALSLNDIQHRILIPKFKNPLIMYGLFQGVVGSPNLRIEAYKGDRVIGQLKNNASEFINSSRGTKSRDDRVFRVSYFYGVNRELFPNFDTDLKYHLLGYIKGDYERKVRISSRMKPDISAWYISDLHEGNSSRGNANTNNAALLGAFRASGGGIFSADGTGGVADMQTQLTAQLQEATLTGLRFPPHVMEYLRKKRLEMKARQREGEVSVDELGIAKGEKQ